tara:strand:+ start:4338 stop:4583 length:246 start_codon:yes stop_codon:yes gene_type:complete
MGRIKLVKVTTHRPDLGAVVQAVMTQDADAMGDILDAAFEFKGPLGGLLEGIDGVVWDELAKFLIENLPELADKLVAARSA